MREIIAASENTPPESTFFSRSTHGPAVELLFTPPPAE
jgi:hypothetical protein